jgi:hypothetical protein
MTEATKEDAPQVSLHPMGRLYLDLEVPLRDLTYMAGIARDIAYELLDLQVTRTGTRMADGEVTLRMSEREYEQFFFAISDVHDRAESLEKTYQAQGSV